MVPVRKTSFLTLLAGLAVSASAFASSHREAPAISQDAPADITDVYAFKGKDSRHVTLVMNVYPGMLAASGPNWYRLASNVKYDFHIANSRNPNLVYRFEFGQYAYNSATKSAPVAFLPPIKFVGFPFADDSLPDIGRYDSNLAQGYFVSKLTQDKLGRQISGTQLLNWFPLPVAPERIGPATTDYVDPNHPTDFNSLAKTNPTIADQNYTALANKAIQRVNVYNNDGTVSDYRFFVGPRNDPFFVDLGGTFDALNVRVPGLSGTPVDALKGVNVFSIVMEVPTADILPSGETTFGVWGSTSRAGADGEWVQVERLGNPLVNEVIIGLKDKDRWNHRTPYGEDCVHYYVGDSCHSDANGDRVYKDYFTSPGLVGLLNALYAKPNGATAPILEPIDATGREELYTAFNLGLPGINQIVEHSTGRVLEGDMLRVNLAAPIGWPNGRTLKDDIVKTELIVVAQCKLTLTPTLTIGKYASSTVNCNLDDGVTADDLTLGGSGQTASFPYVGIPHSSYGVRGSISGH